MPAKFIKNSKFSSGGLLLSGVLFYPSIQKDIYPSVLFVNGWAEDKRVSYQYAEALSKLGFLCFLFDMRGHGDSEGDRNRFSNKDFLDDVLKAYDFLCSIPEVDTKNINRNFFLLTKSSYCFGLLRHEVTSSVY